MQSLMWTWAVFLDIKCKKCLKVVCKIEINNPDNRNIIVECNILVAKYLGKAKKMHNFFHCPLNTLQYYYIWKRILISTKTEKSNLYLVKLVRWYCYFVNKVECASIRFLQNNFKYLFTTGNEYCIWRIINQKWIDSYFHYKLNVFIDILVFVRYIDNSSLNDFLLIEWIYVLKSWKINMLKSITNRLKFLFGNGLDDFRFCYFFICYKYNEIVPY